MYKEHEHRWLRPNPELSTYIIRWKPTGDYIFMGSFYNCLRYLVTRGGRTILDDSDGMYIQAWS